jgi:hypothetical protein
MLDHAVTMTIARAALVAGAGLLLTFAQPVFCAPPEIGGRLVDAGSGEGVANARVQFMDARSAVQAAEVRSDADGYYRSGALPPGVYHVRFSEPCPDDPPRCLVHYPMFYQSDPDTITDLFEEATAVQTVADAVVWLPDVSWLLKALPKVTHMGDGLVTGRAVSSTGAGLAGVEVRVLDAYNADQRAVGVTGADGSFSLEFQALSSESQVRVLYSDPRGIYRREYFGPQEDDAFLTAEVVEAMSGDPVAFVLEDLSPNSAAALVQTMIALLPADGVPALYALLRVAEFLLLDQGSNNDVAVCGIMTAFAQHVERQEGRGDLTSAQAEALLQGAGAVEQSLACR